MSREAASDFAARVTVADLDRDPYPIYARLRRDAPVAWVPAVGLWLATSWRAAERVASDPELFAADLPDSPIDRSFGSPTILTCDGSVHRDLRRGVDPPLRPAAVAGFVDGLVGPIVDELLDRLEGRQTVELMSELFEPASVLSLGAVLGLGDLDAPTLRRWFAGLADGATNFERDPAKQRRSDAVAAEIDALVGPRLERLRAEPDDGLVSHMLHGGRESGRPRAAAEIMPSLKVILLGGMQEPGHGAGSVMLALLRHPDQLEAVRDDVEGLLPPAIEEGMRWIAPIGTQGRRATREVEVEGQVLPIDAPVAAVVAAANRDPDRYADPDRFDIRRERRRPATFGFGRHFCSGHALARAQERIMLARLLERHPRIELDPAREPEVSGWEFRAPRNLDVVLG
ncbi:cytochrome P450 [Thermoleophilia bacterium SCSIO 60948]|nr:cytochrome P450 [Thermoleophilia bacterium SCSIO 60948]